MKLNKIISTIIPVLFLEIFTMSTIDYILVVPHTKK
jgi:hypothetical protein